MLGFSQVIIAVYLTACPNRAAKLIGPHDGLQVDNKAVVTIVTELWTDPNFKIQNLLTSMQISIRV